MKKNKIFLCLMALSLGLLGLVSCEKTQEPTETPTVPPVTEPEKVQYALTVEYPDGTTNTIKMDENTTISLNDYVIPFENMEFVGFYKEETFETRIFTYTFTENGKVYAKYSEIEETPKPTPNPNPTPNPEPVEHTCTYEETYSYDTEGHFKKCTSDECDKDVVKEAHTFVNKVEDAYLYSEATYEAKAKYFSHCEVCGMKGELFEHGDRLYHTYTLRVETNLENLYFTFDVKETDKIDYEAVTNTINNHESVKDKFDFNGLYLEKTYETKFNDEYLKENTTVYINLDKLTREVKLQTVGLDTDTSKTLSLNRNSKVTLDMLENLNTNTDYELVGWYLDDELKEEFEEFELLENVTLYASYTLKMKVLSYEFSEITYPEWYLENEYSDSDTYTLYVTVNLSKEATKLDAVLTTNVTDVFVEMESYSADLGTNSITVYFTVPVSLVLENDKFLEIKGIKLTIDDTKFDVLEENNETALSVDIKEATKQTPRLTSNSSKSDFASFVKHIDFMNFVWYDTIKANFDLYEGDYELNSTMYFYYLKTIVSQDFVYIFNEINLNNIDVLCADIILNEDIHIISYEQYQNSIFSYENFMGRLDLNGHTINLDFDGYSGNGLFKNNYGEIFNGNVMINGIRNSRNSNSTYNTLDFSSALLENNFGYVHDLEVYVNNFGYNFETNHNVDSVIGVNREFALVEDCSFNLQVNYVGTKSDRIKNPLITSNAGIFREVRNGSVYSHMPDPCDKQELKNLFVVIETFECSEELKEEGLISLSIKDENVKQTCDAKYSTELDEWLFTICEEEDTFYGGNYYYDGESYLKANSACLNILHHYEEYSDIYVNTGYGYTNTEQLKSMEYFLYTPNLDSETKVNVCEYGYLLPEFAMVAYDDCNAQKQFRNCFDECTCGNCIKVAAFTNSYLWLECEIQNLNIRTDEFYCVRNWVANSVIFNDKYTSNYYINGFASDYPFEKPALKETE